jgi:alginate O-acetyltransferase complex protein AlgI
MLFTSVYYAFFLPLVVALYWAAPRRARYPLLLGASYLFYMNWIPVYLLLILALTVVNFGFGLVLARRRSRAWLALAVATDLGVLAYFKYANFLLDAVRAAGLDFPTANILLPLGISFFTFEFIHYVVDVWRGDPPVRDFVRFALFAAFFPTQIAGPIKRYQAFTHQMAAYPRFDAALAADGLGLILRGLFKKVVLADNLARVANLGFDHPAGLSSGDAWIAVYAFAFQIFFDFSGYTDIGRGSAQLFGFTVPENFAAPYLARNLAVFWRRWHISLSSWLRDYLFIPLGGSRGGRGVTYRNLFLTMALGGLWHGAAWHFVAWGAFQGAGLVALRGLGAEGPFSPRAPRAAGAPAPPGPRRRAPLLAALAVAATFHFTCLGWVLFRAPTLPDAAGIFTRLLWPQAGAPVFDPADRLLTLTIGLGYFVVAAGLPWLRRVAPLALRAEAVRWRWLWQPAGYAALVVWMVVFPAAAQRFIYFQF